MKYLLKSENDTFVGFINPTKKGIEYFTKEVGKSLEELNEELNKNGYFMYRGEKVHLETIFIDLNDEEEE